MLSYSIKQNPSVIYGVKFKDDIYRHIKRDRSGNLKGLPGYLNFRLGPS